MTSVPAFQMLNDVIVPNIQTDRIIVAINQADLAMKGCHWDSVSNCPDAVLPSFLRDKASSVRTRIHEATGVWVRMPVCYSASCRYNILPLLDLIIDNMPKERRKLMLS